MNPEIPKYKLIFLGDQSVGKSCILNRFLNDTFIEEYQTTIGLDFQSKNVQIDNQDIHLLLYDTAGQEKFRSLIPMYTRDANIILLVYDISNRDSFTNLSQWLKDLTNVNMEEIILCVVGNKIDLIDKRAVNIEGEKNSLKNMDSFFRKLVLKLEMVFLIYFIKIYLNKLGLNSDQVGNYLLQKLMTSSLILNKMKIRILIKGNVVRFV